MLPKTIASAALAICFLGTSAVHAEEAVPMDAPAIPVFKEGPELDPQQPLADAPEISVPTEEPQFLLDGDLQQLRGGETLVVTDQTLVAVTSGNVINGNYTAGPVSISDMALSNFNGFGNLLINTGAQVSLQTGMNVTINVTR
jgi:hypothetical protein